MPFSETWGFPGPSTIANVAPPGAPSMKQHGFPREVDDSGRVCMNPSFRRRDAGRKATRAVRQASEIALLVLTLLPLSEALAATIAGRVNSLEGTAVSGALVIVQ